MSEKHKQPHRRTKKSHAKAGVAVPERHRLSTTQPAEKSHKLLHRRRIHWFAVLIGGLLLIQFAYNLHVAGQAQALSYATDITHQELLDATNARREATGMHGLQLNQKLNTAAEAKAQDMIAKNYWSHLGPDGASPWKFIEKADYPFQKAGENLAYGFKTGESIVAAWMESPTHRDNIMSTYRDVGFGYASGDNYQGGKNTVVVAFFATPATGDEQPKDALFTNADNLSDANSPSQHVLGLSVVATGAAGWGTYASLGMIGAAFMGFAVTHLEAMRLGWQRAKRFAVLHPLLDAIVIAVVTFIIIQTAGGVIR